MPNKKLEAAVKSLITALGEQAGREGLKATPERVAKAYEKIFSGYGQDPHKVITTFTDRDYDEMIVIRDVEFYSTCEHHLLPFFGKAHIGYIPDGKIIGLSKLPRIVDIFSRRMQNQERMTVQIAETLLKLLKPRGVGVVIEAQHLCIKARGVEKQNASVTTSAMLGLFKKNLTTRSEFLKLIGK